MQNSHSHWSACSSKVVILNKKHGTNTYNMKLSLFTTIKSDGVTCVLCEGLIQHQDESTFKCLYPNFENTSSQPIVIYTDSDQDMSSAIKVQ